MCKSSGGCRQFLTDFFRREERLGDMDDTLQHLVGREITQLQLVNGYEAQRWRLLGYDREALFFERGNDQVAVMRASIASFDFMRSEGDSPSKVAQAPSSLASFLRSLVDGTVEYTTVVDREPDYLCFASFNDDSIELVQADDATTMKYPKLIPLSALCHIGRGSPPAHAGAGCEKSSHD